MKKIKKRHLTSFLFIMSFLCIVFFQKTTFVEAAESLTVKQFNIELEYGLNGTIKDDCDMPILVHITNTGNDFEGKFQILNADNIAYEFDLNIAKGETQSFKATIRYSYYKLQLKIVDSNGKAIVLERITTDYDSENFHIGLLSDDASSLKHFKSIVVDRAIKYRSLMSFITELDKDDIPTSSAELSCLTFLVINSFDTSQLSVEQCQAIQEWVSRGGVLIIGTGADASTTLSAFKDETKFDKDFLSVTVNGAVEGDMIVVVDEEKETTQTLSFVKEDNVHSISIEGGQVSNNANFEDSYFTFEEQLSLIQKKEFGKGAVVVTGFNLSSDPVKSLKWKKRLAGAVLSDSLTEAAIDSINSFYIDEYFIHWSVRDILGTFLEKKMPNLIIYTICFVLFILGIGPVGYLILKKKKKTHWMWGLIPIGTIGFLVVLYLLSISSSITKPASSNFTVLEVNDDNTATQTTYMGIVLSDLEEYEIQLQPEYKIPFIVTEWRKQDSIIEYSSKLREIYEKLYGEITYNDTSVSSFYVRATEENLKWTIDNLYRFTKNYIKFDNVKNIDNCSFDIQITEATTTQFAGSVTNNTGYDLIEAFICYGSLAVYIGDFANGETKTFTADDCLPLPEFSADMLSKYIKTSDDMLKDNIQRAYSAISKNNTYSFVHPILMNELNYNDGSVFGYIPEFKQDIIANKDIEENGAGVIHKRVEIQPSDMEDDYSDNLFNFSCKNYTDNIDYLTYMMTANTTEMECIVPWNEIFKMVKSDVSPLGDNCDNVVVWAFNYKTGQYERLFKDGSNEMIFTDSCPYLNPNPDTFNGNILLRFDCAEYVEGKVYLPKISLIGESK